MSKQIVKRLTMLTLVVGLALVSTVVPANGQLNSHVVTADIPFEFIVADQTFPAGKYTVRTASDNGKVLKIVSLDGKSSIVRLSNSVTDSNTERNARMVFHRYGQEYFLAQVWSGDNAGRQLIKSKKELHLEHERALIASSGSSKKTVEVLALY
jgi:CO dehydrogenase/acetyl-CoA synthase delta subunit